MLRVHAARDLPRRHPVADRHRVQADEGEQLLLGQVALDDLAAERVRPVEDDDRNPARRAGLHHERRRPDERVVAAADVRQIRDDDVEALEVLGPSGRAPRTWSRRGRRPEGARLRPARPPPCPAPRPRSRARARRGRARRSPRRGARAARDEAGRHRGRIREKADPLPSKSPRRPLVLRQEDVEAGRKSGSLHPAGV